MFIPIFILKMCRNALSLFIINYELSNGKIIDSYFMDILGCQILQRYCF